MFHDDTGIPIDQLGPNDQIEGPKLGYSKAAHRALSGVINKKYFADVQAATTKAGVGAAATIGALSQYTWTTIPKGNQAK